MTQKRQYTRHPVAFKKRILKAIDNAPPGCVKKVLLKEGVTWKTVAEWRKQAAREFKLLPFGPNKYTDSSYHQIKAEQYQNQLREEKAAGEASNDLIKQQDLVRTKYSNQINDLTRKMEKELEALKLKAVKKLSKSIGVRRACKVLNIQYRFYYATLQDKTDASCKTNTRRQC
jgi:hypothetical protein